MTDKRFKWLLIVCSLTCIIVTFIWKFPETVKANAKRDERLGDYVYVDSRSIIHVSRKCPKLNYKGMKSTRNKAEDLFFYFKSTPIHDITFCPQCVNDEDYEILINIFSQKLEEEADRILRENQSLDRTISCSLSGSADSPLEDSDQPSQSIPSE